MIYHYTYYSFYFFYFFYFAHIISTNYLLFIIVQFGT